MPGLSGLDPQTLFAPVAGARKLALAVSGGPDSLALMLLAAEWARGEGRPSIVVYSVDHGLRPEAADEVAMVLREAARLRLAARGLKWRGDKPETGIQAAARKARYQLMAEAMSEDGAEFALTGHQLSDQAETVLMRLAHGSGVEGLGGIDAFARIEGCEIFRPLLSVAADELLALVRAAGLTPAFDPSNRDRHYERVRWRQMMPALADLGLDAARLGHFAKRMADADVLIALETDKAFAALVYHRDGLAELPRAGLAALPRAVGVRLVGKILRLVGGERKPHGLGSVEALFDRLAMRTEFRTMTLHGCVVACDGVMVSVAPEGARRGQPELMSG